MTPKLYWKSKHARLICGDACAALESMADKSVHTIIADPPYFLSGKGSTCKAGRRVAVSKGEWDAPRTPLEMHAWNLRWLDECRRVMTPHATIWVSGTSHNIFSIGYALQTLGFRILNDIAWIKPNPPPNLGRRCFTHATETVIWASRDPKARHVFEYAEMRQRNGGKQMRSDWTIAPPRPHERDHGKHPTQKPLALVERMLAASHPPGGTVLDPFCGSGTTGAVARHLGDPFVGIDLDPEYLEIAKARILDVRAVQRAIA